MCRNCAEQQRKAAKTKQDNSVNPGNGQKVNQVPGKSNDKDYVLFNALLSYVSYAMQNSSIENIKHAVLGHFSSQEVINSKDLLWETCDMTVIGEKFKRKDSQVRTEKEANLCDILSALVKLDEQNKSPKFAVLATDLNKIPKFNPEEIISTSVVERLVTLESKFCHIQSTLDRCLCDNMALNDKLNQKASYSSVVANSDHTTHEVHSDSQAVAPLCVNPNEISKNTKDSNITAIPRDKGFWHVNRTFQSRSQSLLSLDQKSVASTDTDGFHKPSYELKKIRRRNAKSVVGKGQLDGMFRGAPLPKSLFIYRVNKDTYIIRDYVTDQGIDVLDLICHTRIHCQNHSSLQCQMKIMLSYTMKNCGLPEFG